MVTLLDSGESPRFIARRLVILASEDVGLADPTGILVADAVARAVEFVGLPEARLNLAQAVVHLALAPKSNSVTRALGAASEAVAQGGVAEVPDHLRSTGYRGAAEQGWGVDYKYAHSFEGGWVAQQYLPDAWRDATFYDPASYGAEGPMADAWRERTGRGGAPDAPAAD